jgi:transcription antitermination factor NusG
VLTEGFGKIAMAARTFDLLKKNEGHSASVSGATQIRAGVMRPEIIIAKKDVTHHEDKNHEPAGLELNDVVRIIREPWFGKIGVVSDLPPELAALDTEAKVRVLKVKLDGTGEEVVLPRANIEKIEA